MDDDASIFRALADPTRRQILQDLRSGELAAGEIAARFPMSGPSVSRHLSVLRSAGLVRERRDGNRIFYSLVEERLALCLGDFLSAVCPEQAVLRHRRKKVLSPNQDGTTQHVAGFATLPVVILAVLTMVAGGIIYALVDPLGLNAPGTGHFPSSLLWASPDGRQGDTFVGFQGMDAAYLTQTGQGSVDGHHLTFVDADTPSTSYSVISVNPIDRYTWSATALGINGSCYAILLSDDPSNPQYGMTYYARFPAGGPCEARLATSSTVQDTSVPQ